MPAVKDHIQEGYSGGIRYSSVTDSHQTRSTHQPRWQLE